MQRRISQRAPQGFTWLRGCYEAGYTRPLDHAESEDLSLEAVLYDLPGKEVIADRLHRYAVAVVIGDAEVHSAHATLAQTSEHRRRSVIPHSGLSPSHR